MADNSVSAPDTSNGETTVTEKPQYITADQLNKMLDGAVKRIKSEHKKELDEIRGSLSPKQEQEVSKDPEKAELFAKVKESEKQLKLLLKERDAAREREKELNWHSNVDKELTDAGFDSRYIKFAKAYLKSENLVKYDEEGNLKMGSFDLSDGVKQWASTDEAKLFMSPKGTLGSGAKTPAQTPAQKQASPYSDPDSIDWGRLHREATTR